MPEDGPDDDALLAASQRGDDAAFGLLVRRYGRAVHRLAWSLTRSASDADDLTQETFVRAWRAIARFERGQPLYPWLARIVTNTAFSLFRHRRRRPEQSIADPGFFMFGGHRFRDDKEGGHGLVNMYRSIVQS